MQSLTFTHTHIHKVRVNQSKAIANFTKQPSSTENIERDLTKEYSNAIERSWLLRQTNKHHADDSFHLVANSRIKTYAKSLRHSCFFFMFYSLCVRRKNVNSNLLKMYGRVFDSIGRKSPTKQMDVGLFFSLPSVDVSSIEKGNQLIY